MVSYEISMLTEGIPTVMTLIRLLSSVHSIVVSQVRLLPNFFLTYMTLKWLLFSVSPLVLIKTEAITKAFPTFT